MKKLAALALALVLAACVGQTPTTDGGANAVRAGSLALQLASQPHGVYAVRQGSLELQSANR